jgi:hypothetical protein
MVIGRYTLTRHHMFQLGILSFAAWVSFYFTVILPIRRENMQREISYQKASGLGAVADKVGWEPVSLWHQASFRDLFVPPRRFAAQQMMMGVDPQASQEGTDDSRHIIRTANFDLEVKSPSSAVDQVRRLAERMGGFLVQSDTGNDRNDATIEIRVPTSRYEETRNELQRLALRVDLERVNANDVTKEYADRQARLRNLTAQEAQYLSIMKQAHTVKDTLDVSAKLSEVRGQIEQQQAEFAALAKQVQTVDISVSLRAEADAQVFGLHWRPLYEIKLGARDGLESVAAYTAIVVAALFRLPAFLLWLTTIIAVAAIVVRSTRWIWRRYFALPQVG